MKFEILEEFLTLGWSVLLRCEEAGDGVGLRGAEETNLDM